MNRPIYKLHQDPDFIPEKLTTDETDPNYLPRLPEELAGDYIWPKNPDGSDIPQLIPSPTGVLTSNPAYLEGIQKERLRRLLARKAEKASPAPQPIRERTTFEEAVEKAFWDAGGEDLLRRVAVSDTLEYLKLCAKVLGNREQDKGVHIQINSFDSSVSSSLSALEHAPGSASLSVDDNEDQT